MRKDLSMTPLWKELMAVGKTAEKTPPVYHTITEDQLYDILGTIDSLGPMEGVPDPELLNAQWRADMSEGGVPMRVNVVSGDNLQKQHFGFLRPKYRLFDELGMALGGRLGADKETITWAGILAKAYIACVKEDKVKTREELYNCVPQKAIDKGNEFRKQVEEEWQK